MKGNYADLSPMKNPVNFICTKAIRAYLSDNTPIDEYIKSSESITDFITVRTVTGGAMWRGDYLGKAIRFYHSTDGDTITYKKNGNKVPTSDNCKPVMDLPDNIPNDIDYNWYIENTYKLLETLGVK